MCLYFKFVWFGFLPLFNGISTFVGQLMLQPSLYKGSCGTIQPMAKEEIRASIRLKVNVIERLVFKLAFFGVTVSTLATSLVVFRKIFKVYKRATKKNDINTESREIEILTQSYCSFKQYFKLYKEDIWKSISRSKPSL